MELLKAGAMSEVLFFWLLRSDLIAGWKHVSLRLRFREPFVDGSPLT